MALVGAGAVDVGFAWSGGGVPALLCTMCEQRAMEELGLFVDLDISSVHVATISGGTMGWLGYVNANASDSLCFPPSWDPSDYNNISSLEERFSTPRQPHWFASALDYIPSLPGSIHTEDPKESALNSTWLGRHHLRNGSMVSALGAEPVFTGATSCGDDNCDPKAGSKQRSHSKNWWVSVLDTLMELGYGLRPDSLGPGRAAWTIGAALMQKSAAPITVGRDGTMVGAAGKLLPAEFGFDNSKGLWGEAFGANIESADAGDGSPKLVDTINMSLVDASGMSSAFWGAGIVKLEEWEFDIAKHALMDARAAPPDASRYFGLDGGFVDTTGVTQLLRRRAKRIVVLYNCNHDLRDVDSTIGSLFGQTGCSGDGMDMMGGSGLSQVFPTVLWPQVIANLTLSRQSYARLQRVPVLQNQFFGVEAYVVDELLIVANQRAQDFIDVLSPNVRDHIDTDWPNKYPVGMSDFDANLLCVFQGWKVRKLKEIIQAVVSG